MRTSPFGLALAVLTGALLVGACSGPPTFQSQSLSQAPSIDGELSEWGGTLTRMDDPRVSMSVVPTDSVLYMALLIPEQDLIRAVAKNGLIVWVDPSDSQAHTYGVQYPLGLRAAQRSKATSTRSEGGASLDDLFPSDLAIIRNDTIRHRMPAGLSSDLRVQATLNTGSLVYEIAIPRSGSDGMGDAQKHGLLEPVGSAVAVGIETPDPEEDSDRFAQSPGIPSVTGRGRRGRTRRGRRGRRQQRQRPSPSVDAPRLDLWARVVTTKQ